MKVTKAQGESLASEYGIKFFETSAKNNISVSQKKDNESYTQIYQVDDFNRFFIYLF